MRKYLLFFGIAFLIAFEILRVYLIMPLPGSQEMTSIDLAYFLGSNELLIRTIGLGMIATPFYMAMRDGKLITKILLVILVLWFEP